MVDDHGVCSCQEGYIGSPPACRPECVTSTDCPQNQACIRQKCKDPCPGTCGTNARCLVINHNPICTCKPGFTGDPFNFCQLEQSKNHLHTRKNKNLNKKLFDLFDFTNTISILLVSLFQSILPDSFIIFFYLYICIF